MFYRHQACSSSTKVPQQSFGCRKTTGFPCAPIFGSSFRHLTLLFFTFFIASCILSTCFKINFSLLTSSLTQLSLKKQKFVYLLQYKCDEFLRSNSSLENCLWDFCLLMAATALNQKTKFIESEFFKIKIKRINTSILVFPKSINTV